MPNRSRQHGHRAAIAALVTAMTVASVPALALADIARTALSDRLSLISGAGSIVVVLETLAGLALVDSGAAAEAEALIAFLDSEFSGAPVRVVFNTHWHPDNTGANELLAAEGATIIAHRNTRLWMDTEYFVDWQQKKATRRDRLRLGGSRPISRRRGRADRSSGPERPDAV